MSWVLEYYERFYEPYGWRISRHNEYSVDLDDAIDLINYSPYIVMLKDQYRIRNSDTGDIIMGAIL